MSTYRKKPVEIEAQQFDGTWESVNDWLTSLGYDENGDGTDGGPACHMVDGELIIQTLEGDLHASPGDFIIRGVQGEFYPCKPDIFAATYDRVERGMSTTTRTKITATPLYPGSLFPEDGRPVVITDAEPRTALTAIDPDDVNWFALDVRTVTQKRLTDGDGGELWQTDSEQGRYRLYIGDALTAEDVERLPGDHRILLANMRGNDWERVVRTRRGNFQPVEPGDVVLPPAEASR